MLSLVGATFSPQFHGLGTGRADSGLHGISDQVKLLVASIQYGVRYSEDFRLNSPIAFMNRLVNEGQAGNARPIGRDYILVEKSEGVAAIDHNGIRCRRKEPPLTEAIMVKQWRNA